MSTTTPPHGTTARAGSDGHGSDESLTTAEVAEMNTEQAMIAAAAIDGVYIEHRRQRFPVPGTKTERSAERVVSACFLISAAAAVAFIVVFVAVPFHYRLPGQGSQTFKYYTPLLGVLLGITLFGIGIGAVLWAKWLMPEEEVVQERHGGASPDVDQLLTVATLKAGFEDTGLARRSMLKGSLGLAGGALGIVPLVALVGALIKKPGQALVTTLWVKGVAVVYADGRRVSPGDLEPGSIATVFPGVPGGVKASDSPTLLIRLRPGQTVKPRKNQADMGWGDYVAFSKICTHAGCPASLFEQQTTRLLCPCHQSQFEVLQDCKPVFGPATRALPKLPLTVETGDDGKTYFVAGGPYPEAIGPAFWERP
ncbi:MAG: qcrA [Pseudonocardiales bacterium]|nr:qcrA [Pseudonocardiales bacterium]